MTLVITITCTQSDKQSRNSVLNIAHPILIDVESIRQVKFERLTYEHFSVSTPAYRSRNAKNLAINQKDGFQPIQNVIVNTVNLHTIGPPMITVLK